MQKDSVIRETFQGVTKGMNAMLDPAFLPEGQASRLLNVVVRNGLAESRPALVGQPCPVDGRLQGAFSYELEGNLRWVLVVSGEVWAYSFATNAWRKMGEFPTKDFAQAWFCQAGKYAVVQNGIYSPTENWPIIFHGDSPVDNLDVKFIYGSSIDSVGAFHPDNYGDDLSKKDPPPNPANIPEPALWRVPIGKAMAFGQGRLFVAVERYWDNGLASGYVGWRYDGLRHILAGNDEWDDDPDRILVFTDSDSLNGGGALTVPAENGLITSLAFFRNASTGTGLGELVVLCRRGSSIFAVSVKRGGEDNQWGLAGFGQVLFQASGSSSPWAVAAVNADLVYRGDDGLRTIKFAASAESASGGLATYPISPEIGPLVSRTDPGHEAFVTLAVADNYALMTSHGVETSFGDVAFLDILPWDLANFQASGESPSRVFAGAWRGPLFHAVLKISATQCGAIYRDADGAPLKYGLFSSIARDPAQMSVVRTGAFGFKSPFDPKRVKYADLMFDKVSTDLSVRVRWRADGKGWRSSDFRAIKSTYPRSTGPFRVPVEMDNDGTGCLIEFAIEWTGHARLRAAAFSAAVAGVYTGGEESSCSTIDLDAAADAGVAWSPEE